MPAAAGEHEASGTAVATGIDACPGGWVAVTLGLPAGGSPGAGAGLAGAPFAVGVRVAATLAALEIASPAGIDMPLGLLGRGWRHADALARRALGRRGSTVFAIAPRPVWAAPDHATASQRCRALTGQGLSIQAWGLRERLLDADRYRRGSPHPLHEVHPELAFGALAGAPLAASKHTPGGRAERRRLLAAAGISLPPARDILRAARAAAAAGHDHGQPAGPGSRPVPGSRLGLAEHDLLDAAAVAWSARRIAAGVAVTLTDPAQRADDGCEIAIRY